MILLGLAVLILVVALFLPKKVKIISETEINLPLNKVYYSLVTFTDRSSWDPWITQDSTIDISVTLKEGHIGSKYSWTSEKMGSGEMVIDSVMRNSHIYCTLSFAGMSQKPLVWYDLSENAGKANVLWGFSEDASYPAGRIFMSLMKSRIKADYDLGLANLKKHLEEHGVKMSKLSEFVIEEIPGFTALVIPGRGTMDELSTMMGEMFGTVMAATQAQGLQVSGAPFVHYLNYDEATGISDFEAGVPVMKAGKSRDGVKKLNVSAFTALKVTHTGPYQELGDTYNKIMKHIEEQKIDALGEAWEIYLTDPMQEPDEMKWQTVIAFPLKK